MNGLQFLSLAHILRLLFVCLHTHYLFRLSVPSICCDDENQVCLIVQWFGFLFSRAYFILLHLWHSLRLNFLIIQLATFLSFVVSLQHMLCTLFPIHNLPLHWLIINVKANKKKKKGNKFYVYMCLKNWLAIKDRFCSFFIPSVLLLLRNEIMLILNVKRPWQTVLQNNVFAVVFLLLLLLLLLWHFLSLCAFLSIRFTLQSIYIHVVFFDWLNVISVHSVYGRWCTRPT